MKSLELKLPPLLLVMLALLLMYFLQGFYPLTLLQYRIVSLLGGVCILAGIGLVFVAARQMRQHQATLDPMHPINSTVLLNAGVFAVSRNPIYLGMVIILLGSAVIFADITAFLVVLLFVRYITRYQIEPEEACLLEKFPADFAAYCEQVRRWV